ncbi:MAG: Asd/ArgC dimerization domain-containing protein, partial [Acidobacteriota bacterium]
MTIAAIIEPMTLLGSELRRALQSQKDSFPEVRALTFDSEAIGAVTEIGDRPALVQQAALESLEGVDLVFACGSSASATAIANDLAEGVVTILIDPKSRPESSVSVVAGVNLAASMESNLLVSPDPATVLLAHLLAPLSDLEIDRVDGHLMLPASARGQEALDELFNQTRAILAMNRDKPESIFGAQLAFNLLPFDLNSDDQELLLTSILESSIDLNLDATQAGVFHSLSASVL